MQQEAVGDDRLQKRSQGYVVEAARNDQTTTKRNQCIVLRSRSGG